MTEDEAQRKVEEILADLTTQGDDWLTCLGEEEMEDLKSRLVDLLLK